MQQSFKGFSQSLNRNFHSDYKDSQPARYHPALLGYFSKEAFGAVAKTLNHTATLPLNAKSASTLPLHWTLVRPRLFPIVHALEPTALIAHLFSSAGNKNSEIDQRQEIPCVLWMNGA